jgi:hypothetical protein
MRISASVLLLMTLAGCTGPKPFNTDFIAPNESVLDISVPTNQAIAVIGYRIVDHVVASIGNPAPLTDGVWVHIDPKTGLRNAKAMPWFTFHGGALLTRDTAYNVYTVSPGVYALGWVQYGDKTFEPTIFQAIQSGWNHNNRFVNFSDLAKIRPNTPFFVISPGEVAYVGDIVLDFSSDGRLNWRFEKSEEQVREYLAKSVGIGQMIVRGMQRADGKPLEASDGVAVQ